MASKDPQKPKPLTVVETIRHYDANRKNIPTAEYQSVMDKEDQTPIQVAYQRRNRDLDPQLVWRGKDEQDWSDLVVHAPPIYIQEKVHPKVLIKDLLERSGKPATEEPGQASLFGDFNGIPAGADKTDFYQHDANWTNRMILGDSLQVMASLAEREGLRGQVQCIYFDPPYGIKFNSNFQWSTTSRDVKDGNKDHITREPEMVKAFRDTWRDGIHSYLSYLRDRLTVARDLLTVSGSIFVQIGDENVHRVRALMDEVFGDENYVSTINFATTGGLPSANLSRIGDFILLYARDKTQMKWRKLKEGKKGLGEAGSGYNRIELRPFDRRPATSDEKENAGALDASWRVYSSDNLNGQGPPPEPTPFKYQGRVFHPSPNSHWKPNFPNGLRRLALANRVETVGNNLRYVRFFEDNPSSPIKNIWLDTSKAGFASDKSYVVETSVGVIARCILLTTDPGDLVLDPTCGSGSTATVAEEWGRRWITIDTSRVALALARSRIMGARYPFYLLADSPEGQAKESELTCTAPSSKATFGNIRHGFVYDRVPHITLKSIANNAEIDVIWEKWQSVLEPLRLRLNANLDTSWEEWEIPREAGVPWDSSATIAWRSIITEQSRQQGANQALLMQLLGRLNDSLNRSYTLSTLPTRPFDPWGDSVMQLHEEWWTARIDRQKEIDASIAAKADTEYLYDKPYEDKKKVRVAGPFTVESLSPHRTLAVAENDELIDPLALAGSNRGASQEREGFVEMILENLRMAGIQQAHKEDKITLLGLSPWPGCYICAEGMYEEAGVEKRAGIFLGPEFGTVSRPDLVEAAREAGDADFDVLIACAFNFDAHSSEFDKLGRIPVLKARMNADLHMGGELKNTGAGNLFVIFGEPDIDVIETDEQLQVKINGVDVFDPRTGEVRSDGADGIACWFIDTDYNGESFFVRHAYFLGANDPYKSLKTTLKAEIDEEAWATLNTDVSRPFDKPKSGRIAVKVINHLGDEVMKVFRT